MTILISALTTLIFDPEEIAAHLGESEDSLIDAESLLNLTDRIGHGTFIVGNQKLMELARDKPFELCLTSNIINKTRESYETHHFGDLFKTNHPLCICTDDKGLFGASLSDEYEHVQRAFNLDTNTMLEISKKSIEYVFDTSAKAGLRKEFDEYLYARESVPQNL